MVAPSSPSDYTPSEINAASDDQDHQVLRLEPGWFRDTDEEDDRIPAPTSSPLRGDAAPEPCQVVTIPSVSISTKNPAPLQVVTIPSVSIPTKAAASRRVTQSNATLRGLPKNSAEDRLPRLNSRTRPLPPVDRGLDEFRARHIFRVASQRQKPKKQVRLRTCHICEIKLSPAQFSFHVNGQKHKKRVDAIRERDARYNCEACGRHFFRYVDLATHKQSRKHRAILRNHGLLN